jgi:hypothetical protein
LPFDFEELGVPFDLLSYLTLFDADISFGDSWDDFSLFSGMSLNDQEECVSS